MKKLLVLLLLTFCIINLGQAQGTCDIDPELQQILKQKSDELISVNIILKSQIDAQKLESKNQVYRDRSDKRSNVLNEFKSFSEASQSDVLSILQSGTRSSNVKNIQSHWITNMINCEASSDIIYQIAQHPDVAAIAYNKLQYMLFDEEIQENKDVRGLMTDNITKIKADKIWEQGYTGKGILVSILDTGVNTDHVDLKDHLWDGGDKYPNHGYNTLDNNHNINDTYGHGTHCAGTICGDGTSGIQTGIAPDATLMCIKVLGDNGEGSVNAIVSGVEFSIENGADLLSLSLGVAFPDIYTSGILRRTFENLLNFDVLAAVAAGNDRSKIDEYPIPRNINAPGNCPPPWIHPDQQANAGGVSSVLCVGAVDYDEKPAYFSSEGPVTWSGSDWNDYSLNTMVNFQPGANENEFGLIRPDVSAPGCYILSSSHTDNNGFNTYSGTSMATPCVAGAIALMLEKNPDLTPALICKLFETTAVKLSDKKSNRTGSGRIDALAAMELMDELGPEIALQYNPIEITTGGNIALPVTLRNDGTVATHDIVLSLTTEDTCVTIVNGTGNYGVLLSGQSVIQNFVVKVNTSTPDEHEIIFTLTDISEDSPSDAWTATISAKVSNKCYAPSTIRAKAIDGSSIKVTWSPSPTAKEYQVLRDGEIVATVNATSYTDKGLKSDTRYCYSVTSICNLGPSEPSKEACTLTLSGEDIAEESSYFNIYPNPVDDRLIISTNEIIKKINIYNVVGILIYSTEEDINTIDMSDFNSGVYFINIKTENEYVTKQFIKK